MTFTLLNNFWFATIIHNPLLVINFYIIFCYLRTITQLITTWNYKKFCFLHPHLKKYIFWSSMFIKFNIIWSPTVHNYFLTHLMITTGNIIWSPTVPQVFSFGFGPGLLLSSSFILMCSWFFLIILGFVPFILNIIFDFFIIHVLILF